ncbi:cyclic nucleotide-binding domain-containing protein [Hydrogenophaga taeniospiralis]|jgi:CRP-like cAMP-binding protein|uniref:Crp/Fnr family transcriptional regulator n=1 Tax=Hydrogenophaga taeniospiralis TaxID=65656 RepID=UPI0008CD25A1|nr:cyclic nucleotide-binding domain-containing protein [Hydrogenophaga taeniospiralis]OGB13469.1 MAG: Crp/Fnr family transcriptional regulator [Burkholderiales bacterium RIFCSPLOWO2_02_FULL_67_64]OGB36383.1 MAG: Crp/Fnr family transcriptional regulator [Burkholderiales bacterium RIFCSPHIGHO2_12_FULL_67_38]OGB39641.1 MAG: Crp/Fnr family transcriptional regulator [Burkholderiales bacterium RIFCSPLOWO2_12_67_14]OGB98713.1 MAG: Crp/Fnr family transcriptional regulator [Burkholderiales bacterium RIF
MNASLPNTERADVMGLAHAMAHSNALDAVPLNLDDAKWQTLANYLQPVNLQQGQALIEQGVKDRTVYFVESGSLTVHYEDSRERVRIAVVGAGSLLGEGAFFSHLPRSATVHAGSACRLWCLTPLRFRELSTRYPEIALDLTVAMSAVLARRMYNKPKRVAVT